MEGVDPGQDLDEVECERQVLGHSLAVGLDRVAEEEPLRLDRLPADRDDERLLGRRLGQVVPQPLGESGPLALEVRHRRDHRHRVPARWMGLGIERGLAAHPDERLLGQGAAQEVGDVAGDLVRRSAQAGIVAIARLGEGAGRPLAQHLPGPLRGGGVGLGHLLIFEEQGRVFVAREEAEQHPVGQLERSGRVGPAQLHQAAVLGNRPDVLDALGGGRSEAEEILAPDPRVLLLPGHGKRGLRLEDGRLRSRQGVRRDGPGRGKFGVGANPDAVPGMLAEPGEGDAMTAWQVQNRLPDEDGRRKRRLRYYYLGRSATVIEVVPGQQHRTPNCGSRSVGRRPAPPPPPSGPPPSSAGPPRPRCTRAGSRPPGWWYRSAVYLSNCSAPQPAGRPITSWPNSRLSAGTPALAKGK